MSESSRDISKLSPAQLQVLAQRLMVRAKGRATDQTIPRRNSGAAPLSFAQERVWFHQQIEPDSHAYNVPVALRLEGHFDTVALGRSVEEILRRHEILRSRLNAFDGQPVQAISPIEPLDIPIHDLQGLPAAEREAEAERLARKEALLPFDLATGPMLRVRVLRLSNENHLLLCTMHHLVSDGWSMGVLVKEFGDLYTAYAGGKFSPLPELSIQYADYAAWQRDWLRGEGLDRQLSYWKNQLASAPTLDIPTDHVRPPYKSFAGGTLPFTVSEQLAAALRQFCQAADATPFMVLLAAFKILLQRYSGQDDIVVGSTIAGRNHPQTQPLIGLFINTLVLRTDLSDDPTLNEMVARVRRVCLEAYAHADLPFERLVEELQPERDMSRTPLFQVMFMLLNAPLSTLELAGLKLKQVELHTEAAKFDLMLTLEETSAGLSGKIVYDKELFEGSTVERLVGHYLQLLESIVARPEARISELAMLSEAEQRRLLSYNQPAEASLAAGRSLTELFAEQVRRTPQARALSFGEQHLSYAELDYRADCLARQLRRWGIGPEQLVALLLEPSLELVVGVVAVLKAGGAYLPIDVRHPPERVRTVLADSGARVLLTQAAQAERLLDYPQHVLCLDTGWSEVEGSAGEEKAAAGVAAAPWPEQLAYVIYTSGSTGTPKGVLVTHDNVAQLLAATRGRFGFGSTDVWTLFHSPAFDLSVWEVWGALTTGARLVIVPYLVSRDPKSFHELLLAEQVTVLNQTPTAFQQLAAAEAQGLGESSAALALRVIIFGGEALELSSLAGWVRRHGLARPQLVNMYGITETTVHSTFRPIQAADLEGAAGTGWLAGRGSPIGERLQHLSLYVLDARGQLAAEGVAGELYVGGLGLARGYRDRPELTAEKFVPDPFSPQAGTRLYRSGDLARRQPGGELEYLGRLDRQVKVRGFRIELGEIEAVLSGHAYVHEVVVLLRQRRGSEDSAVAGGEARLVAYVVLEDSLARSVSAGEVLEQLRRQVRERLPEYMAPAAFVVLERLPLTSNGKLDRAALPEPGGGRESEESDYCSPRSPVEEVVAAVWAQLLGVDRVGLHDNFFELGGHSLLATQVIARLRDSLNVDVSLRTLFETPTVEAVAAYIETARGIRSSDKVAPVVAASHEQPLPLSFQQQRLWFLDQLEPGGSSYNIPAVVRLTGTLDVPALENSLTEILCRHEVLRTTFRYEEGQSVQVINDAHIISLPLVDLTELRESERETEAQRLSHEEAQRPFDLQHGPLLRAKLLKLSDCEHVVLLTMHHIASDGWSLSVLYRELIALYEAFVRGEESPLPALTVQYADYAVWQQKYLSGEVFEEQLSYWRKQLGDGPPMLELPTDKPRPAIQSLRGARVTFELAEGLCESLKLFSQREGVTLYMTLLAAFLVLLHRYTHQEDISIGTPVAGRDRTEIEGLIGFFVNTLVLRAKVNSNASFSEFLKHVREVCLKAYAHADVPFERIVEELQPDRDMSRTPLFQVAFAFLQTLARETFEIEGVRMIAATGENQAAKFDLTLAMSEADGKLSGALEYCTDLFTRETAERLVGQYERLLERVVSEPQVKLGRVGLLSVAERERMLERSQGPRPEYAREQTVDGLFAAQAARAPEAVAVSCGSEQLSYGELEERANRLAQVLRRLGVGEESRVGLLLGRSAAAVVTMLAVLKAGGAYLPLDWQAPARRWRQMLADAGAGLVLTTAAGLGRLAGAEEGEAEGSGAGSEWSGKVVSLEELEAELAAAAVVAPHSEARAESLAYVMYTSGSTGVPKGVMVTHRNVSRLVLGSDYASFGAGETTLLLAPLSFDASTFELWGALLNGGRLAVMEQERPSLEELGEAVERQGVTTMWLPAGLFHVLMAERAESLRGVKQLLAGGDVLDPGRVRRASEVLAEWGGVVINGYGPTETTTFACCHRLEGEAAEPGERVPIGRPIAQASCYVLDGAMELAGEGMVGELYIGGDGVARGYLGCPELTAERFVPDRFVAGAEAGGGRLYRTGDLVRWRAGRVLEFVGRVDSQVKVRGFRVELGEIEAALRSQAEVKEAVVVAAAAGAAEGKRLVAYLVANIAAAELDQRLRQRLPEYMIPNFVFLDSLPLSPNGKVDRRALPPPDHDNDPRADYVAPRTALEEMIADIWVDVLGRERVSINDNFFELNGHSLLAMRVVSRVRQVCGVELPLRQLFESPTVELFAARVEKARGTTEIMTSPPLMRAGRDGSLPLSFAQQRLWFIEQMEPGTSTYNVCAAIRLSGRLDVAALEQTLSEIVRRHESLRTRFAVSDGQPVQLIDPPQLLRLAVTDLSHVPAAEREAKARRLAREEAVRPFDLVAGPLLRTELLRLEHDDHLALLTMHHVVSDGWSVGVFVREVAALYDAFSRGEASPLEELEAQYADFAVWQREWLQGEVLERLLAYWRGQLRDLPPLLELPTDRPRPPLQTFRGASQRFLLSTSVSRELRRLGRDQGVTLFMLLLTAFKVLLGRYARQSDVCVGTPVANRTRVETEPLIGCFVNTLVLRTDLGGDPTFVELLGRVRRVCLEAYAHADLPFERLVEELQPERDMSRTPLFQVMFMLLNAPLTSMELAGLKLEQMELHTEAAKFDLMLTLEETSAGLSGKIVYDKELFEGSTVERLVGHYLQLLESIVARPEARISELAMLSEAERRRLLSYNQPAEASLAAGRSLTELFAEQVRRQPQARALSFGEQHLSYAELDYRADCLARQLRRWGIGPEQLVALLLEPSLELVVGMVGVLKAGGAYLPIDVRHPPERVRTVLADSGARVLLTQAAQAERLLDYPQHVLCLDTEWSEVEGSAGEEKAAAGVAAAPWPEQLAYVIYTSGSTGTPKGVLVTHDNVAQLLAATRGRFGFGSTDVWTLFHSPAFDFSVWEVWGALTTGARLVIVPYLVSRDPKSFHELLLAEQVTVLNQTPTAFQQLAAAEAQGLGESSAALALRVIIFGGEALELSSLAGWVRRHGLARPQLVNMYGITETTVHSTFRPIQAADLEGAAGTGWLAGRGSPIGERLQHLSLYVLDARGQLAAEGVAGELYVGGLGLARGYRDRPELTAEKFVPDPFSPQAGTRLYRSGDLARRQPGGELEYLGRLDRQVKVRGFRIELGEIEAVLSGHAYVHEVVVLLRQRRGSEDSAVAGGEARLVAYVVLEDSLARSVSAGEVLEQLRRQVRERLPEYMAPAAFVVLERLPLTSNGKLDRAALPEPGGGRESEESDYCSPRSPVEELVAAVWAQLLGVDRVGLHDNFFELGGHSLLATKTMSRLRETLGVELPLRALFESPTIEGLSREVERSLASGCSPAPKMVRVSRVANLPLSFTQQRLWLLQQMEPESGAYNIPAGVRLTGQLDAGALERSLIEVARRHESLRTSFPVHAARPVQFIAPLVEVKLEAEDLSRFPDTERDQEVNRIMEEEAARPFDLEHGPLWRARLLRLGEQEHVLLYTMHHIISDEWSMGVLIREVAALYKSFLTGQQSALEELPVQYADYAAWQRDWLQGEVLDEQVSYWRRQLAGAPPVLKLQTDKPRSTVQTTRGAHATFRLPAELTRQVNDLSRQESATLFMTLLAAFEVLLHKYTGQQDIVVGTPVAGRGRTEIEGLIGAFINALAIRVDLSGDPTFRELLRRVRSVVLGAFAHQDMPFEKLLEVLQPVRQPGHAPLFQVAFNYQQTPPPVIELPNLSVNFVEVKLGKAKYDLTLYIGEGRDGLSGNLSYKSDLFDAETAEMMLRDFERILMQAVEKPESLISAVASAGDADQLRVSSPNDREEPGHQRPGSVRRKAIRLSSASLVRKSYLQPEETLPLVIEPSVEDLDLTAWTQSNVDLIEQELLRHGAILFRGFNVASVKDFRRFASTVTTDLVNYIEGSSERVVLGDQIYTSSEYPAEYFISLHNELSYSHKWPGRLFFCCLQPPQSGGETPIADSRKVFDLVSPQIKESFSSKGVKYVRNLHGGNGPGLSWQMVFESNDRAFVDSYCREGGIEIEWKPEGGLRTSQVRPAVARHPQTGETVWFNQADQWHPSNLGGQLAAGLMTATTEEELPINAYYGDGSPFDTVTLDTVRRAYKEATVTFAWQKGDVMLLDNMLVAHGRMPFSGPRRVAVAMGAPVLLKQIKTAVGGKP